MIFAFISCEQEKKLETNIERTEKQLNRLNSELDTIRTQLFDYQNRFDKLEYLSTGEFKNIESKDSDVYGENYRVEIYLNEIYKSIYITRIEYFGEGGKRITSRKRIDFEKMTGTTEEQTSDLEFLKWINDDEFEIKSDTQIYHIEIQDSDSFIISEY